MPTSFRRPTAYVAVAVLFMAQVFPTRLAANPNGGAVVDGQAIIAAVPGGIDVTQQSHNAIINWQSFSIPAGQAANFHLPNASSSVLNRVVTPGLPSEIFGSINSNGNVFLINPAGIVIGPTGVINTAGFTASTLDIANSAFMRGELHFQGAGTGAIVNQGSITTGPGGVALLGGSIVNSGTIVSNGGSISLVVSHDVTLTAAGKYIQADMPTLLNGVSEYAGVINNSGIIRATGAAQIGGEVYLVNPGGTVLQAGLIAAQKQTADGALAGGAVKIDAAQAQIGGTIDVSGSAGGKVEITGKEVALTAATIDASGDQGGGAVRIGGGLQGKDPTLMNAQSTIVDAVSLISADARRSGSAGSVVVYATGQTDFGGRINARALGGLGNGGFVEVSGRNALIMRGGVDTSSLAGLTGTLLLDPTDFDILPPGSGDDYVSYISADTLVAELASNNVIIQTGTTGAAHGPNSRLCRCGSPLEQFQFVDPLGSRRHYRPRQFAEQRHRIGQPGGRLGRRNRLSVSG